MSRQEIHICEDIEWTHSYVSDLAASLCHRTKPAGMNERREEASIRKKGSAAMTLILKMVNQLISLHTPRRSWVILGDT